MIDRYLLRYFLAVIDQGNFTRAAEKCNVTQPTLSAGISRLEQLVGQPLFNRTNRRVDLTQAGARFAGHARKIEAEFNLAEQSIAPDGRRERLRLGVLNTLPTVMIADLASTLRNANAFEVEFVEGRVRELSERMSLGRIDAALTIGRSDNTAIRFEPLFSEGYGLAMPSSHPLANEPIIAAEALADNVMIVRRHCEVLPETSRHFTQRGVRPFFSARTTSDDRALAYVAAGVGVTIMPDCFAASGVARVPLEDFTPTRTIGLLYAQQSELLDFAIARVAPLFASRG